jgi:hypothetical protein
MLFCQITAPCLQVTAFFSSSYIRSSNPDGQDHRLSSSPLPRWQSSWDTLPGTTSPASKSSHPPFLPKLGKLHRWDPLPFGSPRLGTLLMLILALPPTLSEPPSPYHWRSKIQETCRRGSVVTTHLIGSRDCPSIGCRKPLTLNFTTASLVFDGNAPFLCFMDDQTRSYCKEGVKWAEEYGGCPYWSCKIHWIMGHLSLPQATR